jgi:hypothetical protein
MITCTSRGETPLEGLATGSNQSRKTGRTFHAAHADSQPPPQGSGLRIKDKSCGKAFSVLTGLAVFDKRFCFTEDEMRHRIEYMREHQSD